MFHSSGNILLHFIFSTRGRRPLIKSDFRADLFAYLGGIVRDMNGSALIINGTATVSVTSTNVITRSASRSPQTAPKALATAAAEPLSTCLSSRMPTRSKSR